MKFENYPTLSHPVADASFSEKGMIFTMHYDPPNERSRSREYGDFGEGPKTERVKEAEIEKRKNCHVSNKIVIDGHERLRL